MELEGILYFLEKMYMNKKISLKIYYISLKLLIIINIINIIKMLKFHELERDIINLRTIISSIVIPKLNTIEISEVINLKIRFFFLKNI